MIDNARKPDRLMHEWILRVAKMPMGLCRAGDVLVHRGVRTKSAEEVLEELRNERLDQLSEGLASVICKNLWFSRFIDSPFVQALAWVLLR